MRTAFRYTGIGSGLLPANEPAAPGEPFWHVGSLRFGIGKGDRQLVWMLSGKEDGSGVGINLIREPLSNLNLELSGVMGLAQIGLAETNLNITAVDTDNLADNTGANKTGLNVAKDRIWMTVNGVGTARFMEGILQVYVPTLFSNNVKSQGIVEAEDFVISGFTKVLEDYKTAVHVFIYDTARDSDSGEWRHRSTYQTWYTEALNTSERGDTAKFPAVVIVAAVPKGIYIFNAETQDIRMWMVIEATHPKKYLGNGVVRRAHMLNGVLYVATSTGLRIIDFIQDSCWTLQQRPVDDLNYAARASAPIVERNRLTENRLLDREYENLITGDIKGVIAHVYQGTTKDPLTRLPRATIDVITSAGINRILPNKRTVAIYSDATLSHRLYSYVATNDQGDLFALNTYANQLEVYRSGNNFIENAVPDYIYKIDDITQPRIVGGALDSNTRLYAYGDRIWIGWCDVGTDLTLIEIKEDRANEANSLIWVKKKGYTSGWLAGDYRAAWLIRSKTVDRSPFNNSLTEVGTVTEIERINNNTYVTGFTANDYLERGYASSDGVFDFDTEWSIYFWYNIDPHDASGSGTNTIFDYGIAAGTGAYMRLITEEYTNIYAKTFTVLNFTMYDGTTTKTVKFDAACDVSVWTFCAIVRRGNWLEFWANGSRRSRIDITGFGTVTQATGTFRLGRRVTASPSYPGTLVKLEMFRIAVNAITPEQIGIIFNDEVALQYDHDSRYWLPRAQNDIWPQYVTDMDYDPETNSVALSHERGFWVNSGHVVTYSRTLDEFTLYPNLLTSSISIRDKLLVAATAGGIFVRGSARLLRSSLDQPDTFKDSRTDDNVNIEFVSGTFNGNWKTIGGIPILENSVVRYDIVITAVGYYPDEVDAAYFERKVFAYRRSAEDTIQPVQQAGEEFRSDNRIDADISFENNNDTMLIKVKGIPNKQFKWKATLRKHENI